MPSATELPSKHIRFSHLSSLAVWSLCIYNLEHLVNLWKSNKPTTFTTSIYNSHCIFRGHVHREKLLNLPPSPHFRLSSASWWVLRSLIFCRAYHPNGLYTAIIWLLFLACRKIRIISSGKLGRSRNFVLHSIIIESSYINPTDQNLPIASFILFSNIILPLTFQPKKKITPKTHTCMASWLLFVDLLGLISNP